MSAVLAGDPLSAARSEGVWAAAWRRFKGDRVGMVSLPTEMIYPCFTKTTFVWHSRMRWRS